MGFSAGAMGTAALGAQVAGAAMSTVGSFFGAKSQASNLKSQARIADINARIADLGAESALEQGKGEVARLTLQAGQLRGRQRTALAANGVDLGAGSAAEIQASADILKDIDVDTIRANASRSAWGHRTQATNSRNQGLMARATASGISPFASAASTLLSSATSVATSWYAMQQGGMFDAPAQYDSIDHLAVDQ